MERNPMGWNHSRQGTRMLAIRLKLSLFGIKGAIWDYFSIINFFYLFLSVSWSRFSKITQFLAPDVVFRIWTRGIYSSSINSSLSHIRIQVICWLSHCGLTAIVYISSGCYNGAYVPCCEPLDTSKYTLPGWFQLNLKWYKGIYCEKPRLRLQLKSKQSSSRSKPSRG